MANTTTNAVNIDEEDQALLMSAASVDSVIEDAKVSNYESSVRSFTEWFFTILPAERRQAYGNILTKTDENHG